MVTNLTQFGFHGDLYESLIPGMAYVQKSTVYTQTEMEWTLSVTQNVHYARYSYFIVLIVRYFVTCTVTFSL